MKQTRIYKLLKRLFFKIIFLCYYKNKQRTRMYYYSKWIIDNKDDGLLYDYPLNSKNIVIDIGGYLGLFSDKIVKLYNPQLIILEPVKKYFKVLSSKYINNKKVTLHEYGLSNKDSVQKIYISNDGTSLIKKSNKYKKIKLVDAAKFFNKLNTVDLVSMNIEGAEYDVVERLIKTGIIKKIKFLQIQFHSFVPDAKKRRGQIVSKLLKTHKLKYSYPFVWESFELKN